MLPTLIPLMIFGALLFCSLYACKTWISRALFIIVMPIVYGLVWFLCMVVLGCIAMLMPSGIESIIDELAVAISICVSLALFTVQLCVMSRDSAIDPGVYVPKISSEPSTKLPHVVTQRRLMRR